MTDTPEDKKREKDSWGLMRWVHSRKAAVSVLNAAFLYSIGLKGSGESELVLALCLSLGTLSVLVYVVSQGVVDARKRR